MRRVYFKPRFFVIAFVVLAIVMGASYCVERSMLRADAERLQRKTAERNALASEIDQLQKQIDFAQTDAYIERVARDELGLIMPGEVRYVSN